MADSKRKNGSRDMQGENVTPDLSRLSLIERARLAALIEADGDSALREHLLGAIGRSETTRGARLSNRAVVPEGWTQIHVLDRMEEAYRVLASQPGGFKARSSSVWPAMAVQQLSILDQIELMGTGELEQRQQDQNRVRLAP